jgi:hypothetical protein
MIQLFLAVNGYVFWGEVPITIVDGLWPRCRPAGARYDLPADAWRPMSQKGAPEGCRIFGATWTGEELVVWGGQAEVERIAAGGRYDPATDSWSAMSSQAAPTARWNPLVAWTGSRVLVWGGRDGTDEGSASGGLYDPAADSWEPIPPPPLLGPNVAALLPRGLLVLVQDEETGEREALLYEPERNTWRTLPAPPTLGNVFSAGEDGIVWTPESEDPDAPAAMLDSSTDEWSGVSTCGAPTFDAFGSAIAWTGDALVAFGNTFPEVDDDPFPIGALWRP